MELLKDGQIVLNIDGFIISQNLHNKATATSLFGITNKNNLNIGHDDRTWVLEKDIICDTCNRCVGCQTCNSCNGCVSTVGCNDKCQGCTGSCTGCASNCYESCFGDCYTCQDCQTGCTSCNACTAGCDGGCQTECYVCVSCDSCVGCDGDCVGCFGGCQESCQNCTGCASCTDCVSCQTGCQTGCFIVISPKPGTNCIVGCQAICQTCTGCDSNCYTGCTRCNGCTSGCTGGCQTGCQTGCTTACQMCTGDTCDNCNTCNNCTNYNGGCPSGYIPCSPCVGPYNCGQTPPGCPSCYGPSQSIICPSCNNSGQGGQNPCNNGCFNGEYTPDVPDQPKKTWHTYCQGINNGGYNAGINNSCTGGGDDGAHSDCPSEWLEEGHTEEEWNNLDYSSQKEFATKHGYEEENHDPPSDFVSTSLEDLTKNIPKLKDKDIKVETSCDPKTGKITQVIRDKKTGEVLITSEQNEDGSFDYKNPDGTLALEGVKTNGNGEITEGTGYGEDGKKTNLSDGTTTMPDPNTGNEVNVEPQGAGC